MVMTYRRFMVTLTREEGQALLRMAEADCRDTREQVRFLVRGEAARRGLLTDFDQLQEYDLEEVRVSEYDNRD